MNPIRVEITPVVTNADEQTLAQRAEVVQRLENLGHLTAADGELNTEQTLGWQATVNGAVIPLEAFDVRPDDDGQVLVSLMIAADEVSVRRTPIATPVPVTAAPAEKPKRSTWGDPTVPDPRAGILEAFGSGQAPLGEQIDRNAEATA